MKPNDVTIERVAVKPRFFSLIKKMRVERGTKADWDALAALHYKSEGQPFGPKYWRVILEHEGYTMLAGVVILSGPKLLLAPRHRMFPSIKPGSDPTIVNKHRATVINRDFIVNSRSVVDTLFRSVGVGYRMLNLASRMQGKKFTEIQSSMSKYNPFAERAGFVFVKPHKPPSYEKGLALMTRLFLAHPSDQESILDELGKLPGPIRDKAMSELRAFYYRHSPQEKTGGNLGAGMSRIDLMTPRELLKNINQLVFTSPLYGVYKNPDLGRTLPESVPLSSFDNQPTNQPLIVQ